MAAPDGIKKSHSTIVQLAIRLSMHEPMGVTALGWVCGNWKKKKPLKGANHLVGLRSCALLDLIALNGGLPTLRLRVAFISSIGGRRRRQFLQCIGAGLFVGGVRSVEECGSVRGSVEACGGVWRSAEACGGLLRSAEECGGVRKSAEVYGGV